jgi:hypothetical protein
VMRAERPKVSEKTMVVVFDKRIGERDVLLAEAALKETGGKDLEALLIPAEVNRTEVRYQTPVSIEKFGAFAMRLKELNAKLTAVRQGETNVVTVQVQGDDHEKNR